MNYIERLTSEEKASLCEIITGREFKELFKRNESEFSKIKKGFRAKSLNEQQALSIAVANADKPFIAAWINKKVDIWLMQIRDSVERLKANGLPYDNALAETMLYSYFVDNVDLYLKLAGETMNEDSRVELKKTMEDIKAGREEANRSEAIEKEKHELCNQIIAAQQRIDKLSAEREQETQAFMQYKAEMESKLLEARNQIDELQADLNDAKDAADHLAQFDDTDPSALPSVGSEEIVSLCEVIAVNGEKRLTRHADLSSDGYYRAFQKIKDMPPRFANRDRIILKDGPAEVGFYGVWKWKAGKNDKDPSKDYIKSNYKNDIDAIEIFYISEASNLEKLIKLLKDGIDYKPCSRKIMFAFRTHGRQYVGILCSTNELNTANGKTAFSEKCTEMPVYEFAGADILRLSNGRSFYRKAFAGIPSRLCQLKSSVEIVRDIVASLISRSAYKSIGATRKEFRAFKAFISSIPVDDVTRKIEIECRCSNSDAKKLLEEFLNTASKYMDGDSLEDEIIRSAVSASAELQKKTKELIREEWETENARLLDEAREELDSLKFQLKSTAAGLSEMQEKCDKARLEGESLDRIIAEKQKLAEEVETAVAERIQKARENAADFIADIAFISGQAGSSEKVRATSGTAFNSVSDRYRTFSVPEEKMDLEAHHSWRDVIDTAAFELEGAGVAKNHSSGLSAFLCAAYIEKQPILLVGPNADDIVQAFSTVIQGHKYGMLCCEGIYSSQIITKLGADGENIVMINNLIASGWMNRLPEILSNKEIFYIATHPYAEDIQAEPKSLYGFMLPVFTEFFVDKKATGEYHGGYIAEDFKTYSKAKREHKELRILSELKIGALIRNRINELVDTMHGIYSEVTADEEFLFAILPIAYASIETDVLAETIAGHNDGIGISGSLKRELRYILGER